MNEASPGLCRTCLNRPSTYHYFASAAGAIRLPATLCQHCGTVSEAMAEWTVVRRLLALMNWRRDTADAAEFEAMFQARLSESPASALQWAVYLSAFIDAGPRRRRARRDDDSWEEEVDDS